MRPRPTLRPTLIPLVVGFLIASSLAACADGTTGGRSADEEPDAGGESPGGGWGVPQAMVDGVVDQAASESGVDPANIRVVTAEAVTWRDGSLGCPKPGQAYTQALVPGFRVVVEIDGEEVHYHAAQSGEFRACADPEDPAEQESAAR